MKLYRGVKTYSGDGVVENPYLIEPRRPLHSNINVHNVADSWFLQNFNVKARSQTIFCSTVIDQAKEYSGEYGCVVEITVDDCCSYDLIFSEKVYDFLEIEAEIADVNNDDDIVYWLAKKEYRKVNDINELPSSFEGEVMLYCKYYQTRKVRR